MKKKTYMARAVLCCALGAGVVLAGGGAPASLNELLAASDDVLIGRIVDGAASGVTVNISVQIERVLKGSLAPGAIVAASGETSEPSQTHTVARDRGIFFLSAGQGGALRVVPPLSGYLVDERSTFIPLPSVASAVPTSGAGPKEEVMLELLRTIEGGQPAPPGGTIDLLWEYHSDPIASVGLVFRRWLQGTSPKLISIGLRALLPEGDITALARVATDQSPTVNPGAESSFDTATANSIYDAVKLFRNPDGNAVALLGGLATSSSTSTGLRVAAATALARLHTQQTLPYVAQLLSEGNIALVTAAVGALASFANNVPVGGHEPAAGEWKYRTEDTIAHSAFDERLIGQQTGYYVGFWKSWWQQNQADLSK